MTAAGSTEIKKIWLEFTAGSGYLARYAPETEVAQPDPSGTAGFEVFPNPFSSKLSVSFTIPGSTGVSVLVYDLSGRLVNTVTNEIFPAGETLFSGLCLRECPQAVI